jgi:putative flippase GtrA
MTYTAANAAITLDTDGAEVMSLFFMFGWPARWCFSAKQKTHRRLPAMGCLISVNLVYGSNLPSPATCVTPIPHSHAARFGIQFTLAMTGFIAFKTRPMYPAVRKTQTSNFGDGGPVWVGRGY